MLVWIEKLDQLKLHETAVIRKVQTDFTGKPNVLTISGCDLGYSNT